MNNNQTIIVMSDIHLTTGCNRIIGLDPVEKFKHALSHAITKHKNVSHIVFTGDLSHNGILEEYIILKEILKDVEIPITFMMGNHDRRKEFCEVFPSVKLDDFGFLQSTILYENHFLVCLDTLNSSSPLNQKHNGFLCQKRLLWLERQLEIAGEKKVILFMHHPAFPVGFKAMDKIRLINGDDFLCLLDRFKNIVHIVCGHVHRNISGNFRGHAFSIFISTCHQMPLNFESNNVKLSAAETPAYGLLYLSQTGVTVHSEEFELTSDKKKVFQSY